MAFCTPTTSVFANIYNPSCLLTRQTTRVAGFRFSKVHKLDKLQLFYSKRPIVSRALSDMKCYSHAHLKPEPSMDPVWLSFIKDILWGCRSLVLFLFEQPSQLKYIEWPSFSSTLKIAILTIVIVVVLLVLLSSTDAALSFILSLMLKKRA